MTEERQKYLANMTRAALDKAYQASIGTLFNVLIDNMASGMTDSMDRFRRGLQLSQTAYLEAMAEVGK